MRVARLLSTSLLAAALAAGCSPTASNPGVTLADGGGAGTTADGGTGTASGMGSSSSSSGATSSSSGAATSGTESGSGMVTSGTGGSSGTATSGTATSSTATSGAATSGTATSGSATSGSATSGSSTTSSGPSGTPCMDGRECLLGQICVSGFCAEGCRTEVDCPMNARLCDTSVPPNGACVQCLQASDCGFQGAACDNGTCRRSCAADGSCGPGSVCRTSDNVCVQCLDDDRCQQGSICVDNACVPGCRADDGCGPGRICENMTCLNGCRVEPNTCPPGSICDTSVVAGGQCRAGCNSVMDCGGDPGEFVCTGGQCQRACMADGDCADGTICESGSCRLGCRLPNRDCPDGAYCTAAASGSAGECLRGCDTNDDCGGRENVCNVPTHTCVECLATADCTLGGNVMATCNTTTFTCDIACDPNAGIDLCRALGFFCDGATMTCLECSATEPCDAFESCVAGRCEPMSNLPLCAPCEVDDDCGGANDLCVTRTLSGRTERVCGTDCSAGQACPAGTACTQVGGGAVPVRGRQCLPVNSVSPATCAARLDTVAQTECNRGSDCGLFGGAFNGPDAICSGAGASDGLCTVFCTMGGTDCPTGFRCEDPPDTAQQEYRPRCAPL